MFDTSPCFGIRRDNPCCGERLALAFCYLRAQAPRAMVCQPATRGSFSFEAVSLPTPVDPGQAPHTAPALRGTITAAENCPAPAFPSGPEMRVNPQCSSGEVVV